MMFFEITLKKIVAILKISIYTIGILMNYLLLIFLEVICINRYRDKIQSEFDEFAYIKITKDFLLKKVPDRIWDLWWDPDNFSIVYLSHKKSSDQEWKMLYNALVLEFRKLKEGVFSNGKTK